MTEENESRVEVVTFEWRTHPDFKKVLIDGSDFSIVFLSWTQENFSPFEIGSVPLEIADLLQATSQTVLLSPETFQKQQNRHPEISPDYYAVVPVIFEQGEAYEQEPQTKVQFVWEAGGFGFEATVKRTAKGEIYLVSFFRAKRGRIQKTRRKYRRVL